MPNTKSAKKRLRQNEVRRQQNRASKTALRSQLRKVRDAVKAEDLGKAQAEFVNATRLLDRAGARNLIHRNTAARTKSRLQKLIRVAKSGPAPAEQPGEPAGQE